MKNFKNTFYYTLPVILSVLFLVISCSKDDDLTIVNESAEEKIARLNNELGTNLKIDNSVTKDNSLVFDTEEDFKQFIKSLNDHQSTRVLGQKNQNKKLTDKNSLSNENATNAIYSYYYGQLNAFSVTFNFACNKFDEFLDIESWISGFTLGVSYEHKTSHKRSLFTYYPNHYQNQERIFFEYTVRGIFKYNVFVEGIGTIVTANMGFGLYKDGPVDDNSINFMTLEILSYQ